MRTHGEVMPAGGFHSIAPITTITTRDTPTSKKPRHAPGESASIPNAAPGIFRVNNIEESGDHRLQVRQR